MSIEKKDLLNRILKTTFGLFVFSIGSYLTIVADIGLTPWDSLSMGLSYHGPFSFGQIHVATALLIAVIDLLLKEKIGVGTLLDALLVGTFIDIFTALVPIDLPGGIGFGIVFMVIGLLVMAVGQVFYMSGALSCGPRDTLMVAIGKRLPKLKIGLVDILMKVVLIAISFVIGGPIGIGTLIAMLGMGSAMQLVYTIFKFEPRNIVHQGLIESVEIILGRKRK